MTIPQFIARCDAYCQRANVSRVWLSKRLFANTYKLGLLADDTADIGVKHLARVLETLAGLEAALPGREAA